MGLSLTAWKRVDDDRFSHSYGGFDVLRRRIAADALGIDLGDYEHHGGTREWDDDHPLTAFLTHSDCEGFMHAHELEEALPIIERVVESWPDNPVDFVKKSGRQLVHVLKQVVEHDGLLMFS